MPTLVLRPTSQVQRKRRVHTKSRRGCGNCKVRGVKCDELRPRCRKCLLYGVDCNYDGAQTTLHLSAQGSFHIKLGPIEQVVDLGAATQDWGALNMKQATSKVRENNRLSHISHRTVLSSDGVVSTNYSRSNGVATTGTALWPKSLLTPFSPVSMSNTLTATIRNSLDISAIDTQTCSDSVWTSPDTFWHFSDTHLEILARFRDRTALTIGDQSLSVSYRDILCQLAMTHAFLMHMLLSLTLMHDSDISTAHSPSTAKKQKHASLQHWNTATKLFNNLLMKPIQPNQRDAIWATGVIIGAASFWYTNSDDVEQVWPLKPREAEDLGWLRLGDGKRALWHISDPKRPDSMFHDILKFKDSYRHTEPEWVRRPDATSLIPAQVKQIFDVSDTSTIENNVYLMPLIIVSRIRNVRLTHANVISFLYVIAFVTPKFISLLEDKDARAVFIIGWWFKLMKDGNLWWIVARARIESRAIRIWLEREDKTYGLARVLDDLVRETELESPEDLGFSAQIWVQRLEQGA